MLIIWCLQRLLDEEQEEMESAARFAQPRNTDSFDYSNYHTLSEVSTYITHRSTCRSAQFLHSYVLLLHNQSHHLSQILFHLMTGDTSGTSNHQIIVYKPTKFSVCLDGFCILVIYYQFPTSSVHVE